MEWQMVRQTTRAAYFPNGHRRSQYLLLPTWLSTNSPSNPIRIQSIPDSQVPDQGASGECQPETRSEVPSHRPASQPSYKLGKPTGKRILETSNGILCWYFLMFFFSSKIGKNNDLTTIPIEEFIFCVSSRLAPVTRRLQVKFDRVNFSNVNTNGFALWEAETDLVTMILLSR